MGLARQVSANALQLQKGRESRLAILLYLSTCGYSPSVSEIGRAVGLKSKSTVHAHLRTLEEAGRLERVGPERRVRLIGDAA